MNIIIRDDKLLVASIKRADTAEPLPKQTHPDSAIFILSLLHSGVRFKAQSPVKGKMKKNSRYTRNLGLNEHSPRYDFMSSPENGSTVLNSGQLIRGNGGEAKSDIRRLLSCGAKIRRIFNAAVTFSALSRPLRVNVVQVKLLESRQSLS